MSDQKMTSPCISICQIHPTTGECSGCYRTRSEIASWRAMSGQEQAALLSELAKRREAQTGLKRRQTRRRGT